MRESRSCGSVRAEGSNALGYSEISNPSARMGLRHAPFVFSQEGVAMLSAVLRSDRAVHMSIAIVRTFVRMRELMAANKDIAARHITGCGRWGARKRYPSESRHMFGLPAFVSERYDLGVMPTVALNWRAKAL